MTPGPVTIREVDEIGALKAIYTISSPAASIGTKPVTISRPGLILQRLLHRGEHGHPTLQLYWMLFSQWDILIVSAGIIWSTSSSSHMKPTDSLQAFSSSIAGLLSSRAVLQGVGVGDATASPTSALLLSILQDSMGRIATILFAHQLGTSLEPECKMYRLAADIFNDSSMIMDCLSPTFPKSIRVGLLSLSSVLRALCGVAAGSSKASLSAHFAKWGNLAELNAKDSSQETVISLMGMLVGSLVVSYITSPLATWVALISLLIVHITTNYLAVRAVSMTSLNRQRANIVFSTLFDENRVLTPKQASKQERVFERDGVLRWKASSDTLGFCQIGVPFKDVIDHISSSSPAERTEATVVAILRVFEQEEYILWFDPARKRGVIGLKTNASPTSQLKAWSHALLAANSFKIKESNTREPLVREQVGTDSVLMLGILQGTLAEHSKDFDARIESLRDAGWDIDTPSLQTKPGRKFDVIRKQE
ncbi:hypothetical protein CPSG_03227 [Coccidioides posadasii str. Silveira]|uniref:DUF647 domain-containing protein n=1 Tax=Coccidioides posadasii (strain RMSCC 757 / Silveira) TaxID=443226 RepID=E9D148_COCPS|nr:hypothetical protein CPSG_03227 [Coccidioides posadasii str. Silveira]